MTSTDFKAALKAESDRLYEELLATPLYKKYMLARQLHNTYEAEVFKAARDKHEREVAAKSTAPDSQRIGRPGSRASDITKAVAAYFAKQKPGYRAQSLEIMKVLQSQGFTFPGAKPTTTLASTLSHSNLFDNVRGQGYGLKPAVSGGSGDANAEPLDTDHGTKAEKQAADPLSESAA